MSRKDLIWQAWETALALFYIKYGLNMEHCAEMVGRSVGACKTQASRFNTRYAVRSRYHAYKEATLKLMDKLSIEDADCLIREYWRTKDREFIKKILHSDFERTKIYLAIASEKKEPVVEDKAPEPMERIGDDKWYFKVRVHPVYKYIVCYEKVIEFYQTKPIKDRRGWRASDALSRYVFMRKNNVFDVTTPFVHGVLYKRSGDQWLPQLDVDAKIIVHKEDRDIRMHFSHFKDGHAYAFIGGKTSFTADRIVANLNDMGEIAPWATTLVSNWSIFEE